MAIKALCGLGAGQILWRREGGGKLDLAVVDHSLPLVNNVMGRNA
jgi:hypothetical protein